MKTTGFLRLLEGVLELPEDSLHGPELLEDIPEWDSLAVISFIALVDEHFELPVDGEALANAKTVDDLVAIVRGKLSD